MYNLKYKSFTGKIKDKPVSWKSGFLLVFFSFSPFQAVVRERRENRREKEAVFLGLHRKPNKAPRQGAYTIYIRP